MVLANSPERHLLILWLYCILFVVFLSTNRSMLPNVYLTLYSGKGMYLFLLFHQQAGFGG